MPTSGTNDENPKSVQPYISIALRPVNEPIFTATGIVCGSTTMWLTTNKLCTRARWWKQ